MSVLERLNKIGLPYTKEQLMPESCDWAFLGIGENYEVLYATGVNGVYVTDFCDMSEIPDNVFLVDIGGVNGKLPKDATVFMPMDYNKAIIGSCDSSVIYDYDILCEILMKMQEWSKEEAEDWIDYNITPQLPYMGANAPIVYSSLENLEKNSDNESTATAGI